LGLNQLLAKLSLSACDIHTAAPILFSLPKSGKRETIFLTADRSATGARPMAVSAPL
jgi:hypothetical protein